MSLYFQEQFTTSVTKKQKPKPQQKSFTSWSTGQKALT
jgi:hypothetical protein